MNFMKIFPTSLFLFFFSFSFAQENSAILCGDGIDNDNDGLIDCYDGDCYNFVSSCHETTEYLEDDDGCKVIIPTTDKFTLVEEWRTTNVMYDSRIPLVGDVDNDGRTEVVASNGGFTYVIDGETGKIKSQIAEGITGTGGLAIADLHKGDGTTQIFFSNGGRLTRLDYNGTTFTSSSTSCSSSETVNIADFNEDGSAEIFITGEIFSEDLVSIMTLPIHGGIGGDFAVAVDILEKSDDCTTCDGLEFVTGTKVYAVNINDGTYSVAASLDTLDLESGYTAVVDMDKDGNLDIIVADNIKHKVYVWNPLTEKLLSTPYTLNISDPESSRTNMGRPNIGDFDNDGKPEIGMATQIGEYMVLDVDANNDLVQAASTGINDFSSGFTGSSVYDFEGDGINEIVYRDQDSLRVYRQNGNQLDVIGAIACGSLTRHEYPVVVDVDNDDATEILCACENPDRPNASIISVSASNAEWIRARKVWNQHSYFNVNVNDDLTIPQYQSKHHLFPNQALNNFLVQSTYVDPKTGLPTSKGRNIGIDTSEAEVVGFCDEDKVIYKYKIFNAGNLNIPKNTSINYSYRVNGQIEQANGSRVSFTRTVNETIPAGDTIVQIDTVEFRGVPFDVLIKLNTTDPNAAAGEADDFIFGECDDSNPPYVNNIGTLKDLETCKELKAVNDTLTILSNEMISWSNILDNDIINFSADDFKGFKFNFKRYIDTLTTNAFSSMTPGTSITDIIADSTVGEGNVSFNYYPLYYAPIDSILVDSFQYEICHSTIPDLCSSAWVFIRFEYQSDVPEGFNPNEGGGIFEIPNFNVEFFPENILKIYNRWGNKVYEASPYNNDWDGKSSSGQELPVGTYFYVLDRRKEGFKIETGFVYLNR